MRRKIPSTAALIAFEAAARHESFTRAADELALTQSAICRQIGGLEEFLGLALFRRSRRGVKLTAAGQSYARRIAAQHNRLLARAARAVLPSNTRIRPGYPLSHGRSTLPGAARSAES